MDSLENIIEVKEISKSFNNSNFKIENLSFELKKGQITGLVGKNGAGKTTIIKILIGLLAPDSGSIKILNEDLKKNFGKVKNKIGYMHTEYHFYDYLTGREFLQFIGEIKGMKNLLIEERIKTYSEYFELEDLLDSIIINYSHGTKQKLSFISQIINNPDILILDEPLNGLDPIMIKKMRELIKNLVINNDMCILVSAHQLSFIKEICNAIILVDNGRLLLNKEILDSNLDLFENEILNLLEKNKELNYV